MSWSFVAAGLVAWRRRPDNHTCALMVAVGLAYALPGLRLVRTQLGFVAYLLLATLPSAVLAHLLAVFPDGRATSRLQRVFIVANYATRCRWRSCSSLLSTRRGCAAPSAPTACWAPAASIPTARR